MPHQKIECHSYIVITSGQICMTHRLDQRYLFHPSQYHIRHSYLICEISLIPFYLLLDHIPVKPFLPNKAFWLSLINNVLVWHHTPILQIGSLVSSAAMAVPHTLSYSTLFWTSFWITDLGCPRPPLRVTPCNLILWGWLYASLHNFADM